MRGHIEKRGTRGRVTVDLGKDPITGKRMRASGTAATKRDAQNLAESLARQSRPSDRARTVGELLDRWADHAFSDLSPSTRLGYASKVDQYLKPAFGDLALHKLTADRIDLLYRRMRTEPAARGKPLSVATIRRAHAALSSACEQAVKWGWIPSNPCKNASPGRAVRPKVEPPSIEEVRQIVESGRPELADSVALALATGARRGELCGIQWADVDFEACTITIRRSVVQLKGGTEVVEDHRKSPVRTVTVPEETIGMLKARRAKAAADALEEYGGTLEPAGYVLSGEPGQVDPEWPERITGRWRDAAQAAGSRARFHDLRHLHLTALLAAGIPVSHVGKRAGHADGGRILLAVYSHAVAQLDQQAAAVVAKELSVARVVE